MTKQHPHSWLLPVAGLLLIFSAAHSRAGDVAPSFSSSPQAFFTVGQNSNNTIFTGGSPTPTITRSAEPLPANVTFTDNGDGTAKLNGTPAVGTGGQYTFTLTATNRAGSADQIFTLNVREGPAFTSPNSATFASGTFNTFTVTGSGFPKPNIFLSNGSLPPGVNFTSGAPGTGTISGTPPVGSEAVYTFTLRAFSNDESFQPADQTFTLTVGAAPKITSANTTTFTAGTAGTFTVTTTGAPTPGITRTGALPSGVTFVDNGNGTGTLSGTPAAGTGGSIPLTFTATNAAGSDVQNFTLVVLAPPTITSPDKVTFTVGKAGTFTVTTTGFPLPAIARTGVALPNGVTFTDNANGTGTLAGTPAAGTVGDYALIFTATNGGGAPAVQNFTLTVNLAPAITSANTTTFFAGKAGTFTVTTTGSPTPALALGGDALPGGVTFKDNADGTGTLAGTPAAGGNFNLTFTATNAAGTAAQAFTLIVAGSGSNQQLILSGPFATPNPALVETRVDFLAVMNDPTVGSNWNFGDGSSGVIGGRNASAREAANSTASHIYPAKGSYTVVVTATDPATGAVVTGNVVVQVVDALVKPGTQSIRVINSTIEMNDSEGSIQLRAIIHMRKGVDLTKTPMTFHLNGLDETFTFDAAGNGTSPNGKAKLMFIKRAGNSPSQEARITLKITRPDIKLLLGKGVTIDGSGFPRKGIYVFDFDGNSLSYIAKLKFKQKAGSFSARTKFGKSE